MHHTQPNNYNNPPVTNEHQHPSGLDKMTFFQNMIRDCLFNIFNMNQGFGHPADLEKRNASLERIVVLMADKIDNIK